MKVGWKIGCGKKDNEGEKGLEGPADDSVLFKQLVLEFAAPLVLVKVISNSEVNLLFI